MDTAPKSYSVLIIDDDAFLLDMYALKFSQKSFVVSTAAGAVDALEKLRGGLVTDIILVDVVMPTIDGFEFLETINKENLGQGSLVVILSNLGQDEDIERGLKLGASGYIVKAAATPSEVVSKVLELMETKTKSS